MIPLYRVSNMERAVNMLSKHFRQVLVDCCYWCEYPIRFRADKIMARVYFSKVPSQITLWQNCGGVLVRWSRKVIPGPYDAILYAECPRSIDKLDRHAQDARFMCAVYTPPTWRPHFEIARKRGAKKPDWKARVMMDGLERVKTLLEFSPPLTPTSLESLLLARQVQITQPLSAPVSREVAAHAADTVARAP